MFVKTDGGPLIIIESASSGWGPSCICVSLCVWGGGNEGSETDKLRVGTTLPQGSNTSPVRARRSPSTYLSCCDGEQSFSSDRMTGNFLRSKRARFWLRVLVASPLGETNQPSARGEFKQTEKFRTLKKVICNFSFVKTESGEPTKNSDQHIKGVNV